MKKIIALLSVACCLNTNEQNISTIAGTGSAGYSGDGGAATAAKINAPVRVTLDNAGNLYITDRGNNSIRKIHLSTGVITTVAGTGVASFSGDGGSAIAATLNSPNDAIVDVNGNIYIADGQNQRIRKVTESTGVITTIVGTGTAGYNGDGIAANTAEVNNPYDLVIDANGNLLFSDRTNNRVRKITASTNIISTVVGTGAASYSGDGAAATAAGISNPIGLVLDASGNMYIGDYGNKVIRKVNAAGIISTFAGTGVVGFTGDGGQATAAELSNASEMTVDQPGNVYISDVTNHRIRKVITSTGIINTIAGNGTAGYNGDGITALAAELNNPSGTVVDANGNMFICDGSNNRIRKVNNPCGNTTYIAEVKNMAETFIIYPNPNNGSFTIETTTEEKQTLHIYDLNGRSVLSQTFTGKINIDASNLSEGIYNVNITGGNSTSNKKLVIVK